jgi:6-phosphogluconolactonase (cycloisomerase 2 family)
VYQRDPILGALTQVQQLVYGGAWGWAGAGELALAPDGAHAYVLSGPQHITVLHRDVSTGLASIVGVTDAISSDTRGLTLSPDGRSLYVLDNDSIVVFSRTPASGELTHLETHQDGVGGVDGLLGASDAAVSPDGTHVYVGSLLDDAIVIFGRDEILGTLTFLGMIQDGVGGVDGLDATQSLTVSPDGKHLYAGSSAAEGITVFARDAGTGLLTFVERESAQRDIPSIVVSPDGSHVYVTGGNWWSYPSDVGLVTFHRDVLTGALTLDEELDKEFSSVGTGVAVSQDSAHVYVTAWRSLKLMTLRRSDFACAASPATGCFQTAEPRGGRLTMRAQTGKIAWKWFKGEALSVSDFGDPINTLNDHVLCIYDSSGGAQPVAGLLAPIRAACEPTAYLGGSIPCWQPMSTVGYKYETYRYPEGISLIKLLSGTTGASRILIKAKGEYVPMPALPLALPVTVQLQNADGACWTATFSAAHLNDGTQFRAIAD